MGKKRNALGEGTNWYDGKAKRWRARITIQAAAGPKGKTVSAKTQKEMLKKVVAHHVLFEQLQL